MEGNSGNFSGKTFFLLMSLLREDSSVYFPPLGTTWLYKSSEMDKCEFSFAHQRSMRGGLGFTWGDTLSQPSKHQDVP